MNANNGGGVTGRLYEAGQAAQLARLGHLEEVGLKIKFGAPTIKVDIDAFATTETGVRRATEYKSGSVTVDDELQLEKQVKFVVDQAGPRRLDRSLEWRIGGTVDQSFATRAEQLANEYGIEIRLLDSSGQVIPPSSYVPR